jgi:hypothetical protein
MIVLKTEDDVLFHCYGVGSPTTPETVTDAPASSPDAPAASEPEMDITAEEIEPADDLGDESDEVESPSSVPDPESSEPPVSSSVEPPDLDTVANALKDAYSAKELLAIAVDLGIEFSGNKTKTEVATAIAKEKIARGV